MSYGTGSARSEEAIRRLRGDWEQTTRAWQDSAAKEFEAGPVHVLEGYGEAVRRLADSVERLLDNARRSAP